MSLEKHEHKWTNLRDRDNASKLNSKYKPGDITHAHANASRSAMSPALVRDIKARTGMDKMLRMGDKSSKSKALKAKSDTKEYHLAKTTKRGIGHFKGVSHTK